MHERSFHNLRLPHLQLDELRTRLRSYKHVLWLWLAIDPCTKILPVLQLGPRTQNMAHLLIHCLQQILAPGCLPRFSSDGLNLYFYALTAHFGTWREERRRGRNVRQWQVAAGLIYGQVKKSYRGRKLVRVSQVMRLGTQAALKAARPRTGLLRAVEHRLYRVGESEHPTWNSRAGSSHLGDFPTGLTTAGPPRVVASLLSRMSRPHHSLRVALLQPQERGGNLVAQRYRQRTPAMAAGRTNRRWTAREVLCHPRPPVPCVPR